jgi:cytochrome c oxidase assembly protein subunit 15
VRSDPDLHRTITPVLGFLRSPVTLRRLALTSVIVNVGIVVTGGVVRLTGSGLGCPTWPRCTDDSYTTTPAMGYHGAIEFGNRTLISVVGAVAVAGVLVAWLQRHRRRAALTPAVGVLFGVAVQGVVGGITVHLALNPWTVALHFLLSMALLALAHAFWMSTREKADSWRAPVAVKTLGGLLTAISGTVLVLGTVVTGSGPHAGDQKAARTGFDPQAVAQLHADGVFLLVGLSIAAWLALKALGAPHRTALILVIVELSQGTVGFVQYFTNLPIAVVLLHMLGACLVWLATLSTLATLRGTVLLRKQPEPHIADPLPLDPRMGLRPILERHADDTPRASSKIAAAMSPREPG